MDLECQPPGKIGLLGAAYMLGWAVSILWLPRLADIHGRALVYRVSMAAQTIMIGSVFFTTNINTMTLLLFVMGFFGSGSVTAGFVYLMEFIPEKN